MIKKLFLFIILLCLGVCLSGNNNPVSRNPLVIEEPTFNDYFYSGLCKMEVAEQIAKSVGENCRKYGIPIPVAYALIETESGCSIGDKTGFYKTDAKSPADCWGLTQISRFALKEFNNFNGKNYTMSDMTDIDKNIEVGLWYFSFLKNKLNLTRWDYVYISYNVGETEFGKLNKYWFYDEKGKKQGPYYNSWFYKRGFFPPKENGKKLLGKNALVKYNPISRFQYFENHYRTQFQNLFCEVAMN